MPWRRCFLACVCTVRLVPELRRSSRLSKRSAETSSLFPADTALLNRQRSPSRTPSLEPRRPASTSTLATEAVNLRDKRRNARLPEKLTANDSPAKLTLQNRELRNPRPSALPEARQPRQRLKDARKADQRRNRRRHRDQNRRQHPNPETGQRADLLASRARTLRSLFRGRTLGLF